MKRYIKNGVIKTRNQIVIKKDGRQYINPTVELILADGWVEYIPEPYVPGPHTKSEFEIVKELVVKQWNERTDITNEEALDYMVIVYAWEEFIGKVLPMGKIVSHNDRLWRVRQEHTVLKEYEPSLATASLYEVIEKEHEGTLEDPIPYMPPMEIFEGKYYVENDTAYLCTRSSGTALSHPLSALIGLYVEMI
jgi:hypothetical protein